jgi:hypothetical protein
MKLWRKTQHTIKHTYLRSNLLNNDAVKSNDCKLNYTIDIKSSRQMKKHCKKTVTVRRFIR